jgi:hypothetical protein
LLPLQSANPALQEPLQKPPLQAGAMLFEEQTCPHAPQLVMSDEVFTQALPQSVCPVGQPLPPQIPPVQLCPAVHARQAPPPVPQELAVGGLIQVLPLQQPVGQVTALQVVLMQAPATHCWPGPQAGPVPQAQEPLVQVFAVVELHATQATPAVPHELRVGAVQVLPLQQPVGQETALQLPPEPQVPPLQGTPLAHAVPQLPQLEGSDEVVVQMPPPHDVPRQESVSPVACILYSTSRLASAPVVEGQVEPVRSEACRVAPAAKVNTVGPLSDQYCPGASTKSCPLVPSLKRKTAAGQPVAVGVLAVAAMRNTVIA